MLLYLNIWGAGGHDIATITAYSQNFLVCYLMRLRGDQFGRVEAIRRGVEVYDMADNMAIDEEIFYLGFAYGMKAAADLPLLLGDDSIETLAKEAYERYLESKKEDGS